MTGLARQTPNRHQVISNQGLVQFRHKEGLSMQTKRTSIIYLIEQAIKLSITYLFS